MNGLFVLTSINVMPSYKREMHFYVDLKERIDDSSICEVARSLSAELLPRYPYDTEYNRYVHINYNPRNKNSEFSPFEIAELLAKAQPFATDSEYYCSRNIVS